MPDHDRRETPDRARITFGGSTEAAVIGAGPIGIETAAVLKRHGTPYLQFERGPIGETITRWPRYTRFFSSPERDAIAGVPLQTETQDTVTGERYLAYLRSVVELYDLEARLYESVESLQKREDGFRLVTRTRTGYAEYLARYVILATGNMDRPCTLGIPGEELPHVVHVPIDPHRYFRQKLLVVGGRNSAVETAIRCFRAGAEVTISYRRQEFLREHIYSRNYLEISLLVKKHKIEFLLGTVPVAIRPDAVVFARTETLGDGSCRTLAETESPGFERPFEFVIPCVGYRSDFTLLEQAGAAFEGDRLAPAFDPETMETSVPGLFIAGTAAGGNRSHHGYFIGTCHDHPTKILRAVAGIDDTDTGTVPARRYRITEQELESE